MEHHSRPEKAGQSEASVLANSLQGEKKKRWQVVLALMDRFPDNCQRWQGQR